MHSDLRNIFKDLDDIFDENDIASMISDTLAFPLKEDVSLDDIDCVPITDDPQPTDLPIINIADSESDYSENEYQTEEQLSNTDTESLQSCESNSALNRINKLETKLSLFHEKLTKQNNGLDVLEMKIRYLDGIPADEMSSEHHASDSTTLTSLGHGLFPFICSHLENPESKNVISWMNESTKTFIINDATKFALMWGKEKKNENMTKKKLFRSLAYLVNSKKQLKRIVNEKYMFTINKSKKANKAENKFYLKRLVSNCSSDSETYKRSVSSCSLNSETYKRSVSSCSSNSETFSDTVDMPQCIYTSTPLVETSSLSSSYYGYKQMNNKTQQEKPKQRFYHQPTAALHNSTYYQTQQQQLLLPTFHTPISNNSNFFDTGFKDQMDTNSIQRNFTPFGNEYRDRAYLELNDDALSTFSSECSSKQNSPVAETFTMQKRLQSIPYYASQNFQPVCSTLSDEYRMLNIDSIDSDTVDNMFDRYCNV